LLLSLIAALLLLVVQLHRLHKASGHCLDAYHSWRSLSWVALLFACFLFLQFPQIPHYNLVEATEAAKKVMGPYYRYAQGARSSCSRVGYHFSRLHLLLSLCGQYVCLAAHVTVEECGLLLSRGVCEVLAVLCIWNTPVTSPFLFCPPPLLLLLPQGARQELGPAAAAPD
jgi:hypothetical protein